MKPLFSLTLSSLVATMLLLFSNTAFGDCMGPNPEPGTKPPWAGTLPHDDELDPVDADAKGYSGADGTGFGQWAGSDAGAQQPGQGAPWSGVRPPE